ncbi:MAG: HD domain-containing protein, partial [Firmicutes bacterium]|nr:HD domain-containing protein [Bacillota bacterium]
RIHLASSARIAKDMAVQRGVNPELAAIATALHDMGRIVTGKQKDHAHQGSEPARKLLEQLNLFTEEEIQLLTAAVYNHSDKDYIGTDIEEIVKDADVVDCFEFGMELPRPEQKSRYQRYLKDHFGELVGTDNADPAVAKAMTLLKILGADVIKVIDPKQIVTAPWIRFKCQFECPNYGTRPTCPPHTPDHNGTRELLDSYQTAILFHRRSQADTGAMAYKAMRQLCMDGCYKAAAMGNGCGGDEPSDIPTMEACGIDVFETAKACGFEIDRVTDGETFVNFFGLVLVD